MPGVPSSRGCDACRKQKKKCSQAKPSCARCTRLNIPCTGAGQQRFKFIHRDANTSSEYVDGNALLDSVNSLKPTRASSSNRFRLTPAALRIFQMPANQDNLIAGKMVSRIRITDTRYDITCFGSFLRFLPQRIGADKALDAATDAFVTAISNMHNPREFSPQAVQKHGESLRALRDRLGDPVEQLRPETICAVYLIMITEGIVRDEVGHHAEGIACILQTGIYRRWNTPFEIEMLIVMVFSVLMECVGNMRIKLEPWMPEILAKVRPWLDATPQRQFAERYESLELEFTYKMVLAIREPWKYYKKLLDGYSRILYDRRRLDLMKRKLFAEGPSTYDENLPPIPLHFKLVQLSSATTIGLIINKILQQFDLDDEELREEGRELAGAMLELGETALPAMPLGATHVISGLHIVWSAADDILQRQRAEELIRHIYSSGFAAGDRTKAPNWWRGKFADVREQVTQMRERQNKDHRSLDFTPDEEREFARQDCHVQ